MDNFHNPVKTNSSGKLPRVLVLLATYNGARYLYEQLQSLAAQEGIDLFLLVRDDGSTDETRTIFARAVQELNIKHAVLPRSGEGGSASANFFKLLMNAEWENFDYASFCDQDDIWKPQKLISAITSLKVNGCDFYSSNSSPFWPSGRVANIRKNYPVTQYDHFFESASHGCTYVFSAASAAAFSLFIRQQEAKLADLQYHDWLIYAWAREQRYRWYMDSASHILYRQSGSNVIGANVGFRAVKSRYLMLRSGWLRSQSLRVAEVLGVKMHSPWAKLQRWHYRDRLWFAWNAGKFRRRFRDKVVFALACLTIGI